MSQIRLADVPCEIEPQIDSPCVMGQRFLKVLKRINFPNRDKFVLHYRYGAIHFSLEVEDTHTGGLTSLSHHIPVDHSMTDEELAQAVFRLIGQFVIHEFAECFRFDGAIMIDPHKGNRNDILFEAIDKVAKPIVPKIEMVNFTVTFEAQQVPTPQPETPTQEGKTDESTKKKQHPFARFLPKSWEQKRNAA